MGDVCICPQVSADVFFYLEYALRDVHKPIGISDYELGQALPKDIKSGLPSIEELENKLSRDLQDIDNKE